MSFIIKILKWNLLNPGYMIILILAAYFTFQFIENKNLKAQNQALETRIEEVQTTLNQTQVNIQRLENIEQIVQGTTNTQTIIRERIRDVPVNEEDRPFVNDPGLLARASIMRDYQQSYQSERYSPTNNK